MSYNVQEVAIITAVIEIATVAHITNDATVEISYKAPEIENVIGEQRQVYYCVEEEFEKNQDIKIVDDIGWENYIHAKLLMQAMHLGVRSFKSFYVILIQVA